MSPTRPYAALASGLLAVTLLVGVLAGCSGGPGPAPAPATTSAAASSAAPASTGTVAVLMRDGDVDRERGFDSRVFDARLATRCPDCTVTHDDAEGAYRTQTAQLTALVGSGVDVVVLDPVEPLTVASLVDQLRDYGTKVIVVGPTVTGADFRIAFDDDAVGTDQARALVRAAARHPQLLVVNGSPADPSAVAVKTAAHAVLDDRGAVVVGEYDDLGRPRALRTWLGTLLTFYPPSTLDGVYAADDDLAAEVIAALDAAPDTLPEVAGAGPATLPPVTGAGARPAAVRRVVAGTQLMTVYRPLDPGSRRAADLAAALVHGTDPGVTTEVDGTATVLLDPVPVGQDDVADTVMADRYWSVDRICRPALERDCRRAGIGIRDR